MVWASFSNNSWRNAGSVFWLLSAFLILVFFSGGSGRADVQSLAILRPAAIFVCGISLWTMRSEHLWAHKLILGVALVLLTYVALYLIPMPPYFSNVLPGRSLVSEINAAANVTNAWNSTSLVPVMTSNSLFALFVPAAVLLLGVQLTKEERFLLLPILIALGVLSGILGLLQSLTSANGALYLYRITNNGFAVGLFANRNHQAVLLACLFPMLAAFAWVNVKTIEQGKIRWGIAIAVGVILIPLLLVTGSRAGLVLGGLGLASVALIYRRPNISIPKKRKVPKINAQYIYGFCAVFVLGSITVLASRAEALRRILAPDQAEDVRFQTWGPIADIGSRFIPTGSGPGNFSTIFQIYEPNKLLRTGYLNQAHNDWLDIFLTTGIGGLGIAISMSIALLYGCLTAFRTNVGIGRNVVFARVGAVMLIIVMVPSLFDYPLRIPIVACVFTVALLWLSGNPGRLTERARSL